MVNRACLMSYSNQIFEVIFCLAFNLFIINNKSNKRGEYQSFNSERALIDCNKYKNKSIDK